MFGDLIAPGQERAPKTSRFRYRLIVIASDITNGRLLRLPQDLTCYGQDPDELDIALAGRMSTSIPLFFRPIVRRAPTGRLYRVVDGGLLSNFPIDTFDVAGTPNYPTLGFRLVDSPPDPEHTIMPPARESLWRFGQELFNTMLTTHDRLYLDDHAYVRTIAIPVHGVSGTCFRLNAEQIVMLYQSGEIAAEQFFTTWNFPAYKATYRSLQPVAGRQARLHKAMRASTFYAS